MKQKFRLPAFIKPEKYKITLKPNLEKFTFEGEEMISLKIDKPTKQITLHSSELEIYSVEFIHASLVIPATEPESMQEITGSRVVARDDKKGMIGYKKIKISYDKKAETATLSFAKAVPAGKHQLKLKFTGILNDKMRGFYRSKYIHDGKEKYLATTQFESTDARRAFPCFDEPSQKAIFEITLKIPKGLTAISNTMESDISEDKSGYQIIKFAPTPKMSTYLLAFIVGEFESIEGYTHVSSSRAAPRTAGSVPLGEKRGSKVRVFTTPGKKDQAKFALDVAVKCLEFYNDYFGIDYPLSKLDMIAIPDFAAGAMENWGAVTYRESTILIDEQNSSTANKQWVAMVIAHELAHQWFGNLVTMQWWTHLWLNEGFASFIEYLAIDHIFPEWDIWTQFVSTEMSDAFALDALKNTHPIEVEVRDPAEISEIFDRVSYSKGASVLRMLWKYLGEKDFQKGLQFYLKKYSYGNAETQDLWDALEKISGKPVSKIMKNWTGKAGHPVISIKQQVVGSKLTLTQSRFFSSPVSKKQSNDKTIWNIPLILSSSVIPTKVGIYKDKWIPDQVRDDNVVLMDKKTMTIPGIGQKLNLGETSLVRVDYSQVKIDTENLSASDRLGLIRDAFDLAQSGDASTVAALELALSYKGEEDYTVWSALTAHMSQLESLLANEDFYDEFKKYGREIYQNIAQKMGWEKKAGEKHTDSLLRAMVLYKLGSYGDEATIKKAQNLFSSVIPTSHVIPTKVGIHTNNGSPIRSGMTNSIDPDFRGVVYNLVAENGGQQEWNALVKMYKHEDNQQEKDRLGRSLGLFQDKKLLAKTLEFAISKDVRFQNSLGIIASVWHNPDGRYLAWEFVKKNWKMLKERYAGGHYFTRVFQPAGDFTNIKDAKDIERFIRQNPVPEATRTIAQALEQIYSNAEWLKRDKKQITEFFISTHPKGVHMR